MPMPAQYLLRFDDLCPTMDRERWELFVSLIDEFGIRPILAVVPDNKDRELNYSQPDPAFWGRMRAMEAAGATIALHGYRHVCASRSKSLVPLHRRSEFAGVPEDVQQKWISAGLAILRGHGLNPRVFVAPRHGFDLNTLRALSREGIEVVSDGFARVPFRRAGVVWIPQQLWAPIEKSKGLWTICIHSNTASSSEIKALRIFLKEHAVRFTSVDNILSQGKPMPLNLTEWLWGAVMLGRVRLSRLKKKWQQREKLSGGY
jgi:predicted deacetylase